MVNLLNDNLALLSTKQVTSFENYQHFFVSSWMTERCTVSLQTGEVGYVFPLYLYAVDGSKVPNLNKAIWGKINETAGETSPEDVLDYIYAVLHSPTYRTKYKEFLKIDFPRVPYPKDTATFRALVTLGRELRGLHLMESPVLARFITTFPVAGENVVEKIAYRDGNVFVNETQYFGNVPEIAWNFYIGGYQPAQKWLKDRKGRTLSNDDLVHYQKIIIALTETNQIMKEIDTIDLV